MKRSHPAHRMSQYGPDTPQADNPNMTQAAKDRSDQWERDLKGGDPTIEIIHLRKAIKYVCDRSARAAELFHDYDDTLVNN